MLLAVLVAVQRFKRRDRLVVLPLVHQGDRIVVFAVWKDDRYQHDDKGNAGTSDQRRNCCDFFALFCSLFGGKALSFRLALCLQALGLRLALCLQTVSLFFRFNFFDLLLAGGDLRVGILPAGDRLKQFYCIFIRSDAFAGHLHLRRGVNRVLSANLRIVHALLRQCIGIPKAGDRPEFLRRSLIGGLVACRVSRADRIVVNTDQPRVFVAFVDLRDIPAQLGLQRCIAETNCLLIVIATVKRLRLVF